MAANTSFTCYDAQKELFLEFGLTTWTSYPPSLNISIRGKARGNANTNAFLPINHFPNLIANITNPETSSPIQFNYKNGSGSFGRDGDNFQIITGNGTVYVTLTNGQWKDIIQYLNLMYMYAPMIKEIGNTVRMHLIDVLTQVGLNPIDPATNRTKATSWYGNTGNNDNSGGGYQRNHNNGGYNQSQNLQQAPNMNMPSMPPMMGGMPMQNNNMPPMAQPGSMPNMGAPMPPFNNQQQISGSGNVVPPSIIGGGAAPATGNTANLADGLQNMLNGAFMSPNPNNGGPKQPNQ